MLLIVTVYLHVILLAWYYLNSLDQNEDCDSIR